MTPQPARKQNIIQRAYQRFPILTTLAAIAVIGLVLIFIAIKFLNVWTHHGDTSTVPDIKGLSYDQAVQILKDNDLDVVIADSIYPGEKEGERSIGGTVVEVWPKPGATVKAGREVYLTIVAYSPRMVVVDMPLTDISMKQAENYLNAHGITSIRVEYVPGEFANSVVAALVDGQYVTLGSHIPANATVVLQVSIPQEETLEDSIDANIDSILATDPVNYDNPDDDPYLN